MSGNVKEKRIEVNYFESGEQDDFAVEIKNSLRQDEVGKIAAGDNTILFIGKTLFKKGKRKVDKKMTTNKTIRSSMRYLAKLLIEVKSRSKNPNIQGEDLFNRVNFAYLEEAFDAITIDQETDTLHHGSKHNILYLLKTSASLLKGHFLMNSNDDKADIVDKFIHVLNLKSNSIFSDSAYQINERRQRDLRAPEKLATDEDINKLKTYIDKCIEVNCTENLTIYNYVLLRDAICSRLTLFNARRGGEPCRMSIDI